MESSIKEMDMGIDNLNDVVEYCEFQINDLKHIKYDKTYEHYNCISSDKVDILIQAYKSLISKIGASRCKKCKYLRKFSTYECYWWDIPVPVCCHFKPKEECE